MIQIKERCLLAEVSVVVLLDLEVASAFCLASEVEDFTVFRYKHKEHSAPVFVLKPQTFRSCNMEDRR